jgi:hypothetical protein
MKSAFPVTMTAVSIILSGCASAGGTGTMLPGTIVSDQGDLLEFHIEKAMRTGAVTAFNPRTEEEFSGTYVAIVESATAHDSGFATVYGAGGTVNASGFGNRRVTSNIAQATAYLKGSAGTILNCSMQIEAGWTPHGIGTCADQKVNGYRLQF